ncbi:MAG: prolyl oligopeptidase family serine peptidase [Legionella sp.]|uniref:alpha/beta hydrolase family protein n=1 Tax=Legionella sp. TaxID=459 RepID=UPI00284F256D|nr:prolyl oligopeptidase family serine peptidase [Legionella sp.]
MRQVIISFMHQLVHKMFFFLLCALISFYKISLYAAEPPLSPSIIPSLPAHTGSTLMTPDVLLQLPSINSSKTTISWINNHRLIYVLPSKKQEQAKLRVYDLHSKEYSEWGDGGIPKPSPDGQWIAYIKGAGEDAQLWLRNNASGDTTQLSQISGGLSGPYKVSYDFIWLPDSKRLILTHQPYAKPWEKKERPESKIILLDRVTRQSQLLASIDASIRYPAWLPGTDRIVFVKERNTFLYNEEEDKDWVQSLNILNKSIETLAQIDGWQQFLQPTPSPNGKSIALLYDADNPIYSYMLSIGLLSTEQTPNSQKRALNRLTNEMQLILASWSPDSQNLYALRTYGAYSQLYRIDANTGSSVQLTSEPLKIETYALSPDGSKLAWIGEDAHGNYEVKLAHNDGSHIRTIDKQSMLAPDIALSEVREIEWVTRDYPVPMRGLLVMPLNYKKENKYPLIVDIHGGDAGDSIHLTGGVLVSTSLEWQLWAAKGYAVFVPEFRSSASFGALGISRDLFIEHNRLGGDLKDIESGVDYLISAGIADSMRLALIGHSAGALRANWLAVATHRYKAIISKEGWADEWTQALHEPPNKRHYAMYGGTPWEVPENYLKNSALHHAATADTPVLFLMGNPEIGGADAYQTVFQLYYFLKNNGIETQYTYYADEGHVFNKFINRQDALERCETWIAKHFGD